MILADHTITIERPIEDTYKYIANHENYAHWFPGVISIVASNGLPHGTVGKEYTELIKLPSGRTKEMIIPVIISKPPFLFVTEGQFPPLHPRMEVRLEPISENRTQLRWIFSSRNQSVLGRFLVRILAKRNLETRSSEGMLKLKSILEENHSPIKTSVDK